MRGGGGCGGVGDGKLCCPTVINNTPLFLRKREKLVSHALEEQVLEIVTQLTEPTCPYPYLVND